MNIINLLKSLEIFDGLSEKELQQVAEICHRLEVSKGTTLLEQDDIGKDLFILAEGFARENVRIIRPGIEHFQEISCVKTH